MPKKYQHIQEYEKEILELKHKGLSRKEIGEKLGFTAEQIHEFTKRYNRKQRQLAAGVIPNKRGRKPKDYVVSEESQITELKYIITRKEARIKQLEMENKLMRDFLSLTERK